MKSLSGFIKFSFLIAIVSINTSVIANEIDVKPPFGIRNHDIGVAPDFTLQDIDGEKFTLKQSKAQWIFLHFWASWCGPCREEMPAIQRLAENIQDDKFNIVMINTAEDEDTIFEFLAAINVDLNSLMDADGQVTEVWKPRGLPTTFLINPKGEIKYQAIGGREWDSPEYIKFIQQLIASAD
jgi:thiol-disulfide isomerase/thioredoxin